MTNPFCVQFCIRNGPDETYTHAIVLEQYRALPYRSASYTVYAVLQRTERMEQPPLVGCVFYLVQTCPCDLTAQETSELIDTVLPKCRAKVMRKLEKKNDDLLTWQEPGFRLQKRSRHET